MTGDSVPEHNTTDDIPLGTVLVYDNETKSLEIAGDDEDKYYDFNRFLILGSLMRNSEWNKARVLSPYFLKITIDPKEFKTGKQLIKKINTSIKELTKQLTDKITKDELTVSIMDAEDTMTINSDLRVFTDQLDSISSYASANEQLSAILRDQSIVYDDDGAVFLLGGFGPDYYAKMLDCADFTKEYCKQSSYSKMSTEEFLARARGEEQKPEEDEPTTDGEQTPNLEAKKTDGELNVRINYKDFREKYPKVDVFEFWCPIVFTVKID